MIVQPINTIYFKDALPDYYYYLHNPYECYAQKWERNDLTIIQVISENQPSLTMMQAEDNLLVRTFNPEIVGEVKDTDLDIYQFRINFNITEGDYYFRLADSQDELYSEIINIKAKHKDTIFIEFNNEEDHEGFKFSDLETNVGFRVEGTVQEFTPDSNDNVYRDTNVTPVTLSSKPFRLFKLYIGGSKGVPDFILDLVNRIFSCDFTEIDGKLFNKTPDSEWDVVRFDTNPFGGMSMIVQAVDPVMRMIFQNIGADEEEEKCVLLRRAKKLENISDDVRVTGLIKDRTVIDYIAVYKMTASPYTLKIGTSAGGNQLGEVLISSSSEKIQLGIPFEGDGDLYLTGPTEGNQIMYVVYERLNKEVCFIQEEGQPRSGLLVGSVILYGGNPGDLLTNFNLTTGLGKGDWADWAICDGRNGTVDRRDTFAYGWDLENGNTGDIVGENLKQITEANLPRITPRWKWSQGQRNDVAKGRDNVVYQDGSQIMNNKSPNNIDRNPIEPFGNNQPFDVRGKRVLSVFIQKIS